VFRQLKQWLIPRRCLPSPWDTEKWLNIPFLSVDLELTSLDVAKSNILSVGWVQARYNRIFLESCHYQVIKTKGSLHQSPVIHGLIAQDVASGSKVVNMLEALMPYAQTHVWVIHNTQLDLAVLHKAFKSLQIAVPAIVTVDTLQLEVYLLKKHSPVLAPNAATLSSCRQNHDLPFAPAHNALDDALATIELLYAQLNQLDPLNNATLQDFTYTGAIKVFAERAI